MDDYSTGVEVDDPLKRVGAAVAQKIAWVRQAGALYVGERGKLRRESVHQEVAGKAALSLRYVSRFLMMSRQVTWQRPPAEGAGPRGTYPGKARNYRW